MITFDEKTGIIVEDTEEIRERQAIFWQSAFSGDTSLPPLNTDAETPAGQLIDGETALISQKDSDILFLARMFDPASAQGMWQDALARVYFINRQREAPTYVTLECTGLFGTTIPYGAIVQDDIGNTFINTAPATIGQDGTVNIIVRCSEWGPVQVGAGTVNKIITTVPGWDTVYNPAAGITGRNEETRAEFENRRYESVAKNSHGAAASVFGTVANVDNVLACRVLENPSHTWKNEYSVDIAPHSLYISVYGGEDKDIAKAIYKKIDGGCGTNGNTIVTYQPSEEDNDQPGAIYTYYIERPTVTAAGLTVKMRRTTSTPSNIAELIKDAILNNWEGREQDFPRVRMAQTLFVSRFYKSVINSGVDDLVNIQVSYPLGATLADSVEIPADEMPTLDADNIEVLEV